MTGPEPKREPGSETPEKENVGKTHEEFVGDMARPSVSKKEYEKRKRKEKSEPRNDSQKEPGRPPDEGS